MVGEFFRQTLKAKLINAKAVFPRLTDPEVVPQLEAWWGVMAPATEPLAITLPEVASIPEVVAAPPGVSVEPAVVIAPQEGWGGDDVPPMPRPVVVAPARVPLAPAPAERAIVAGSQRNPAPAPAARVQPARRSKRCAARAGQSLPVAGSRVLGRRTAAAAAGSSASSTSCAQRSSRLASARSTSCLTARICAGCIEKLRRPRPSSRRVNCVSPAISPHTLTPLPCALHSAMVSRHQLQHGRMQRVVQVRHRFVGAVDGQRVLDQVVGADRQEVEVLQEGAQRQRRRRDLDHRAQLHRPVGDAAVVQLGAREVEQRQRLADLAGMRQHRAPAG